VTVLKIDRESLICRVGRV